MPRWCERLYHEKAAELILYGRALGLSHAEAEDVVQETFLALLQKDTAPENPTHYCVRSFRNRAFNYRRSFWRRLTREFESKRWFERTPDERGPPRRTALEHDHPPGLIADRGGDVQVVVHQRPFFRALGGHPRDQAPRARGDGPPGNVHDDLAVAGPGMAGFTDHCRAVDAVLRRGRSGEVYCIGARSERPNIDVVRTILDAVGAPHSLITYVTDRPGHDRRYAIDSTKMSRELGWEPLESFESGIERTVAWYRDNREWVERARSGAYRDYYERNYGWRVAEGNSRG